MIELAVGISPQIGAAIIAGLFAMINTALTLYIVNRRPRETQPQSRRAIDVERGGVPEPKPEAKDET